MPNEKSILFFLLNIRFARVKEESSDVSLMHPKPIQFLNKIDHE